MKKNGFTLPELLIAMAIIAVVSALLAPTIHGFMPNKEKVKFFKAYNALLRVNDDLLHNPSIYASDGTCEGLACVAAPDDPDYSSYSGMDKYINLLAKFLETDKDYGKLSNGGNFVTADNIGWTVSMQNDYTTNITIKVTQRASDCVFSANCTKPNQFQLKVDKDGNVSGTDKMSQAFLANPKNMNSKITDSVTLNQGFKTDLDYAKSL